MTYRVLEQRYELIDVDTLTPHPRNPNEGDVGAIHGSIEDLGFYGAVLVQDCTGTILAGEHRWRAAKAAGARQIPAIIVTVGDDAGARILLGDNKYPQLAAWNEKILVDILTELAQTPLGLAGTGFDGDDIDELLAGLDPKPDPKPESEPAADEAARAALRLFVDAIAPIATATATDPEVYVAPRVWDFVGSVDAEALMAALLAAHTAAVAVLG